MGKFDVILTEISRVNIEITGTKIGKKRIFSLNIDQCEKTLK